MRCQGLKAATIYKPKFAEGDPEATRKVANGDMVTVDLTLGGNKQWKLLDGLKSLGGEVDVFQAM